MLEHTERREYWQDLWRRAKQLLDEKGVVVEVQRAGATVLRPNPALKALQDAERMLREFEERYGADTEDIPEAIDPEVAIGARKVGRSSSERRSRGQSSSRRRR